MADGDLRSRQGGGRGGRASIRLRIILLILLVSVPVSAERLVSLVNRRAEEIADIEETLRNLAARAALAQQAAFASANAIVDVITAEAVFLLKDPDACQQFVERLNAQTIGVQGIYIADPKGRVLCASARSALGQDISDQTFLAQSLAAREPVLTHIARGPLMSGPALVLSSAQRNQLGAPLAVTVVGLDLQWLSRIAAETGAAAGAVVDVIDREGTVLVHYPHLAEVVGRNFAGFPLVHVAMSGDLGHARVVGLDGKRRYVAFARFAGSDLRIVVGLDDARVVDPIDREILVSTLLHLTVLGLVLLAAWFAADRLVVKPIRQLASDVAGVGAGQDGAGQAMGQGGVGQGGVGQGGVGQGGVGHEGAGHDGAGPDIAPGTAAGFLSDVGVREFDPLVEAFAGMSRRLNERTAELHRLNGRLTALARTDGLTGLANRRTFDVQLSEDWVQSRDGGSPLGVAMVDVDSFKLFNDTRGHLAGDEALRAVARMLSAAVAGTRYLAARYGGEEFVLLLPGADLNTCLEFAEDVRRLIASLAIDHPASAVRRLTVSIGVASAVPGEADSPDTLLAAADAALYEAKGGGRNKVAAPPAGAWTASPPPGPAA